MVLRRKAGLSPHLVLLLVAPLASGPGCLLVGAERPTLQQVAVEHAGQFVQHAQVTISSIDLRQVSPRSWIMLLRMAATKSIDAWQAGRSTDVPTLLALVETKAQEAKMAPDVAEMVKLAAAESRKAGTRKTVLELLKVAESRGLQDPRLGQAVVSRQRRQALVQRHRKRLLRTAAQDGATEGLPARTRQPTKQRPQHRMKAGAHQEASLLLRDVGSPSAEEPANSFFGRLFGGASSSSEAQTLKQQNDTEKTAAGSNNTATGTAGASSGDESNNTVTGTAGASSGDQKTAAGSNNTVTGTAGASSGDESNNTATGTSPAPAPSGDTASDNATGSDGAASNDTTAGNTTSQPGAGVAANATEEEHATANEDKTAETDTEEQAAPPPEASIHVQNRVEHMFKGVQSGSARVQSAMAGMQQGLKAVKSDVKAVKGAMGTYDDSIKTLAETLNEANSAARQWAQKTFDHFESLEKWRTNPFTEEYRPVDEKALAKFEKLVELQGAEENSKEEAQAAKSHSDEAAVAPPASKDIPMAKADAKEQPETEQSKANSLGETRRPKSELADLLEELVKIEDKDRGMPQGL